MYLRVSIPFGLLSISIITCFRCQVKKNRAIKSNIGKLILVRKVGLDNLPIKIGYYFNLDWDIEIDKPVGNNL
jgi:hypothetical protein